MRSTYKTVQTVLSVTIALVVLAPATALAANLPEAVVAPTISSAYPHQEFAESGTTGSWTNGPTTLSYQWQRCNATGGECAEITGATSSTLYARRSRT